MYRTKRIASRDRTAERGFTLVEVLGALVVGSLVFSFAAFAISGAIESARVSAFNETLALLRVNVQEVYASSRGFGSTTSATVDITSELAEAGAIPRNWLDEDEDTQPIHNFGGTVTVSGSLSYFEIRASNVNRNACRKIVSAQYENWDDISVNGSSVDSVPTSFCVADSDGIGSNELVFTAH